MDSLFAARPQRGYSGPEAVYTGEHDRRYLVTLISVLPEGVKFARDGEPPQTTARPNFQSLDCSFDVGRTVTFREPFGEHGQVTGGRVVAVSGGGEPRQLTVRYSLTAVWMGPEAAVTYDWQKRPARG